MLMNSSIVVVILAILISGFAQAQTQTQVQPTVQTSEERQFYIYTVAGLGRFTGGDSRFQIGGGPRFFYLRGFPLAVIFRISPDPTVQA
jgi:hypothetical protein